MAWRRIGVHAFEMSGQQLLHPIVAKVGGLDDGHLSEDIPAAATMFRWIGEKHRARLGRFIDTANDRAPRLWHTTCLRETVAIAITRPSQSAIDVEHRRPEPKLVFQPEEGRASLAFL